MYLNRDAAEELGARPGDALQIFAGAATATASVAAIVDHDGTGSDGAAVLLPLARAQSMLARKGEIRYVLVSNRGDETSGAALTDAVDGDTGTAGAAGIAVTLGDIAAAGTRTIQFQVRIQ